MSPRMHTARLLLLGAHSAKYIYLGNTSPDKDNMNKNLRNFSNKLKWMWHYRNADNTDNLQNSGECGG